MPQLTISPDRYHRILRVLDSFQGQVVREMKRNPRNYVKALGVLLEQTDIQNRGTFVIAYFPYIEEAVEAIEAQTTQPKKGR